MTEEELIAIKEEEEEEEEEEEGEKEIGIEPIFSYSDDEKDKEKELQESLYILHEFVPYIDIKWHSIDKIDKIEFSIPSSLLPIMLRFAFGFFGNEKLFDIILELDNFNWKKKPVKCTIRNSDNDEYYGRPLVFNARDRFFSENYKPKKSYRCAPLFIRTEKDYDKEVVNQIVNAGFSRMQAMQAASLCDNDYDESINFLLTGQYQLKDSFQLPITYDSCPILYFILEIVDAIFDLQDHCCMCGKPTTPGLKANICDDELCAYGYIEYGAGLMLTKEIRRDPKVADLLFSVFACTYNTDFFDPKPRLSNKNVLKEMIDRMPRMASLGNMNEFELMECIGEKAIDILKWVILACRSIFLSLPRELEIPQFRSNGCYQFMVLPSSLERENIFQQLKKKYGSFFLWHSSSADRWYTIIRQGLQNLSHTNWIPVGAIHGEGIYFTPDSRDLNLQPLPNLYRNSALGNNLQIIALCEVIKLPFNEEVTFEAEINAKDPETKSTKTVKGRLNKLGRCYTLTMNEAYAARFVFVNLDVGVNVVNCPPRGIPSLLQVLEQRANI